MYKHKRIISENHKFWVVGCVDHMDVENINWEVGHSKYFCECLFTEKHKFCSNKAKIALFFPILVQHAGV